MAAAAADCDLPHVLPTSFSNIVRCVTFAGPRAHTSRIRCDRSDVVKTLNELYKSRENVSVKTFLRQYQDAAAAAAAVVLFSTCCARAGRSFALQIVAETRLPACSSVHLISVGNVYEHLKRILNDSVSWVSMPSSV